MEKHGITVRLELDKIAILDDLAERFDRDRSYLIKEAVDSYIELHRWQIERIKKAIAAADAGEFMSDEEVQSFFDEVLR